MHGERSDAGYLDMAARAALRAMGDTRDNPLVGAVIVKGGRVLSVGHHKRWGGFHAEVEAISYAEAHGRDVKGATLYCTLEPCAHHGKQPPCVGAVIAAGIARVVYASADPAEASSGGAAALRAAGVEAARCSGSVLANEVSAPFLHRVATGLPWVTAKWAQSLDGFSATRDGESQWISGARSRARVHTLRSRVDAVVVGVGTALADDPMLTARGVRRVRSNAVRVVLDTRGRLPHKSKLVTSAHGHRVVVCTAEPGAFKGTAVKTLVCPEQDGRLDLRAALRLLRETYGVGHVLVEPGATLLGSLLREDLVNEALVYVAPVVLGDPEARPVADAGALGSLGDAWLLRLLRSKRVGDDLELLLRR